MTALGEDAPFDHHNDVVRKLVTVRPNTAAFRYLQSKPVKDHTVEHLIFTKPMAEALRRENESTSEVFGRLFRQVLASVKACALHQQQTPAGRAPWWQLYTQRTQQPHAASATDPYARFVGATLAAAKASKKSLEKWSRPIVLPALEFAEFQRVLTECENLDWPSKSRAVKKRVFAYLRRVVVSEPAGAAPGIAGAVAAN